MLDDAHSASRIRLPDIPADQAALGVAAWEQPITIDTYEPIEPEDFPALLDTRVYQGSSGRVFPLPFIERISPTKHPREWQAVHLENAWVRLVILPELGGRIHIGYDKLAGYDFFYRNNVIKPALVGLAGPWISGGVEFNWPQHHRPATFLPTDVSIEREADGAVTVWCSDHDPMNRLKGMHGVRLRPDSTVVEVRVRLLNRTEVPQTFLWWANVAAAVNDDYQSFFPPDVHWVADHAKRAVATFPAVEDRYYGVDYPAQRGADRPDGDRLDWYRNIPVPTSYMVARTEHDFFGGYDHGRRAGFVYWADRHVAPGKKQWTWGNAPFGWAWDANLTDDDGPYVELMAGAYTDNQPDFSFLAPGETKAFSQYWYPIRGIGPAHEATRDAAVRVDVADGELRVGVITTADRPGARLIVIAGDDTLLDESLDLSADEPALRVVRAGAVDAVVRLLAADGSELVSFTMGAVAAGDPPLAATEPPEPEAIASSDELYLVGSYLHQYRHATRSPEPYWLEAVRRDPGDWRALTALATERDRAGLFAEAEELLERAIARLTERVPNPVDGEAHYRLGLVRTHRGDDRGAERVLRKAQWSAAWRAPASLALARIRFRAGDVSGALDLARKTLALDADQNQARVVLALALRASGDQDGALAQLREALDRDRLDQWALHAAGSPLSHDPTVLLDVALEYASIGRMDEALRVLDLAERGTTALGQVNVRPLIAYHRARWTIGAEADSARRAARAVDRRHTLPSRLEDVAALEAALVADPRDSVAALLLGSWYYDRGRFDDAVGAWRVAVSDDAPRDVRAQAARNLGIAAFNAQRDPAAAMDWYDRAREAAPESAKILFEIDQLSKITGAGASTRLARLEAERALVEERDDLTVELADLLTTVGRAGEARDLMASRRFQPWEGGEGRVLGAWDRAALALADGALREGRGSDAVRAIDAALDPPKTLGEARHPLANAAALHLAHGDALAAVGRTPSARDAWRRAAEADGDFQQMATRAFSVQTLASITAWRRLGDDARAETLARALEAFADELEATSASVDFFATSLPSMLLFHVDADVERRRELAQLRAGLAGAAPQVSYGR